MLAAGMDQETILAGVISQLGIDAIDSILHRRIGAALPESGLKPVGVAAKEVLHDLPVGTRGRRPALLARSVAIDMHSQRRSDVPLRGAAEELLASRQGIGVR